MVFIYIGCCKISVLISQHGQLDKLEIGISGSRIASTTSTPCQAIKKNRFTVLCYHQYGRYFVERHRLSQGILKHVGTVTPIVLKKAPALIVTSTLYTKEL